MSKPCVRRNGGSAEAWIYFGTIALPKAHRWRSNRNIAMKSVPGWLEQAPMLKDKFTWGVKEGMMSKWSTRRTSLHRPAASSLNWSIPLNRSRLLAHPLFLSTYIIYNHSILALIQCSDLNMRPCRHSSRSPLFLNLLCWTDCCWHTASGKCLMRQGDATTCLQGWQAGMRLRRLEFPPHSQIYSQP